MKLLLKKSYKTKKSIKVCNKKNKEMKKNFFYKHGKITQENEKKSFKAMLSLAIKSIIGYGKASYFK